MERHTMTRYADGPAKTERKVDSRRLLDHLHVGLVLFTRAGHIIDMNRHSRLMLGCDPDVNGRLLDEVLPHAIIQVMPTLFDQIDGSMGGSTKQTVRLSGDEGPVYWEITVSRSAAAGDRDVIVMMIDDVTELKEYEQLQRRTERLERMNLAVREANRLKTEFLANMSHELRTPLNSIIGFADLMASGRVGEPPEPHREFLEDILTSSRHLLQLINDVLDLSKVEAGRMEFQPELVDTRDLLDEVSTILREQASKKDVVIEEHVDAQMQRVVLDPLRLKQVLYNYLSNAVKFTSAGDHIQVRLVEQADQVRLEVEDHGPGMQEDEVTRLFREFEQLDQSTTKSAQGTGLGLALTRRLVEAQGGSVGVKSAPGTGSLFWAVLPQGDGTKRARALRTTHAPHTAPATARILLVEDDEDERRPILRALEEEGYSVEVTGSMTAAELRLEDRHYDAIVLDLLLPDGHGEDLIKTLRHHADKKTPVIAASATPADDQILGFPVVDVLTKPIHAQDVVEALQRAGIPPNRPVLVVDDDPAVQRLITQHLVSMGREVVSAYDGDEALRRCHEQPPGLIILDLLMPRVDGFRFLETFRAQPLGSEVPIIIWTTKELDAEERRLLQQSAQRILQKGDGGTHSLMAALRALLPADDAAPERDPVEVVR